MPEKWWRSKSVLTIFSLLVAAFFVYQYIDRERDRREWLKEMEAIGEQQNRLSEEAARLQERTTKIERKNTELRRQIEELRRNEASPDQPQP